MREARANILRLGGIPATNTYAKLYLALLGQFPWKYVPTIPPEIFLFPQWFFFNLSEMSSWTRPILAPLTILNHFKPTRTLPAEFQLHELYPAGLENTDLSLKKDPRFWAWRNFFLRCDQLLKIYNDLPFHPLRQHALKVAEKWMTERMGEGSEGLAAIFPSMLNAMMALKVLGYKDDHPLVRKADRDFAGLFVDDPEDFRIQPCLSPVWDTAITTIALAESGVPGTHEAMQHAAQWLEEREVRFVGDWAQRVHGIEPSGWAFEHDNKYYPDTDDTMMVLMALRHVPAKDKAKRDEQFQRALKWLLAFQCEDGGWAAFDKDVTARWLEHVPFADHNAILDPTCSDLTARVLELLGYIGYDRESLVVKRAVAMLRRTQESDGSWYGRWGVNYLYGTWQVLRGLAAIGENMDQEWIRRGRDCWKAARMKTAAGRDLRIVQFPGAQGPWTEHGQPDGLGSHGPLRLCDASRESIERGVAYLTRTQEADGSWTRITRPAPGFRASFISSTRCTGSTSRCSPSPRTSRWCSARQPTAQGSSGRRRQRRRKKKLLPSNWPGDPPRYCGQSQPRTSFPHPSPCADPRPRRPVRSSA